MCIAYVNVYCIGIVNVVRNPAAGIRERDALMTIQGAATGIIGLALSPAIGIFGKRDAFIRS